MSRNSFFSIRSNILHVYCDCKGQFSSGVTSDCKLRIAFTLQYWLQVWE